MRVFGTLSALDAFAGTSARPATRKASRQFVAHPTDEFVGPATVKTYGRAAVGLLATWPIPDAATRWAVPAIRTERRR